LIEHSVNSETNYDESVTTLIICHLFSTFYISDQSVLKEGLKYSIAFNEKPIRTTAIRASANIHINVLVSQGSVLVRKRYGLISKPVVERIIGETITKIFGCTELSDIHIIIIIMCDLYSTKVNSIGLGYFTYIFIPDSDLL